MSSFWKGSLRVVHNANLQDLKPLQATEERVGARTNKADLESQPFYRLIAKTYAFHIAAMFGALYAIGGLPAVIWGGAVRLVIVYHITWFVNSASHCWGTQAYNTGDLSRYSDPYRCSLSLSVCKYLIICM